MHPQEAMQYLTQLASDYVRTLPPSAAVPVQQLAQDAINTLVPLVQAVPLPQPEKNPARKARGNGASKPGEVPAAPTN